MTIHYTTLFKDNKGTFTRIHILYELILRCGSNYSARIRCVCKQICDYNYNVASSVKFKTIFL